MYDPHSPDKIATGREPAGPVILQAWEWAGPGPGLGPAPTMALYCQDHDATASVPLQPQSVKKRQSDFTNPYPPRRPPFCQNQPHSHVQSLSHRLHPAAQTPVLCSLENSRRLHLWSTGQFSPQKPAQASMRADVGLDSFPWDSGSSSMPRCIARPRTMAGSISRSLTGSR